MAAVLGLFIFGCTPAQVETTADLVGVNEHIERCRGLQQAKDAIKHRLHEFSQAQRDRLREINTAHRYACSSDLDAMAIEVREMMEGDDAGI